MRDALDEPCLSRWNAVSTSVSIARLLPVGRAGFLLFGRHLVTATLTPGRTTTGLWCDRCNTSSRFVIGLYVICEFGPVHVATVNRCRNCDD